MLLQKQLGKLELCTIFLVELVPVILQKLLAELPVISNSGGIIGRLAMRLTLGFFKQKINKRIQQFCNCYKFLFELCISSKICQIHKTILILQIEMVLDTGPLQAHLLDLVASGDFIGLMLFDSNPLGCSFRTKMAEFSRYRVVFTLK